MAPFGRRPRRGIDEASAPFDPYTAALRWLGQRELSVHQVRARLGQRTTDAEAIDHAVARLTASGALDDVRVARAYVRTASQIKGRGRDRIARELSVMGIARDTARAAIDECCEPEAESLRLTRALQRRLRGEDLSEPAVSRRLFAALVRQGFSPGEVQRALRRAGSEARESPDD